MKHLKLFAALCCAAMLFAACDKSNEPKNDSNDNSNITPSNPDEEVTGDTENGHNYVDLGLPSGLKWATCNVGADTPEAYGNYYAWGETETKTDYSWDTYKFTTDGGSTSTFTKYNGTDDKATLDPEDDAAAVNWGGKWRMPTDDEWTELRENCTWTWTTQNGKKGYKVTSNANGNFIFIPAAGGRGRDYLTDAGGYGYYWSSSIEFSSLYGAFVPGNAWILNFGSDGVYKGYCPGRYCGLSVRPVVK